MSITVRVIFRESVYGTRSGAEDHDFDTVPRQGEALFFVEGNGECSVWIVDKVGYLVGSGVALPCIQVDEYEQLDAPPGAYDRMIEGR